MANLQTNISAFNAEITKFVDVLTPLEVVSVQKKIALEALKRIVLKTPVDTGRCRGNWQVNLTTPGEGFDPEQFDKSGSGSLSNGMAVITSVKKPFQIIWISNNVPYVIYLEDGTSKQAPRGMVSLTVEELRQMFP